jgi:plastocyanin
LNAIAAMIIAAGALYIAENASAGDVSVTQKDKQFSSGSVTIKVGDTVRFLNDDDVTHNVVTKLASSSPRTRGTCPRRCSTRTRWARSRRS